MVIRSANLALRFLLELCALAALGYWGVHAGGGGIAHLGLGIGAPLLAAIVWGVFVAPKATVRLPGHIPFIIGLVVFGVAAVALAGAGQPGVAAVFGVVAVINSALVYIWAGKPSYFD